MKPVQNIIFTAIASMLLVGCAQSPSSIPPVSMGNVYQGVSCQQARALLSTERQVLASLSAAQEQAVTGDAIGVFLIGVPTSSLSGGDQAGNIAASKGKILALEARLTTC